MREYVVRTLVAAAIAAAFYWQYRARQRRKQLSLTARRRD